MIHNLPETWSSVSLEDCADIKPRSRIADSVKVATFLAMSDVSETGEITGCSTVEPATLGTGYTCFQNNDVLVAKITPCFENGKGALAHGLKNGIGFGSTEFHVLRAKEKILPSFLHLITTTHRFRATGEFTMSGSAGQKRVPAEFLRSYPIQLPLLGEQSRIIEFVSAWDSAIEKTRRVIAAKTLRLSHLREHHLTKPNQSGRIKLKTATRESTARNGKRLGREAIMAVTKQVGMRPMREETIAAAIDRYKVVRPKAFAYNPMRLNIGFIALSSFEDDVLVSPDYVVFECDDRKLLSGYLNHLRRTRLWAGHFEAAGSGGVRIRIYYDDLGAFNFPLLPVAEQQRVLSVLDAGVMEIETLERYLSALKTQKRGLMQKLLTGQWRVPVENDNEVAA